MRSEGSPAAAPAHLLREALAHLQRQELAQASHLSDTLKREHPDFAPGWQLASTLALRQGQHTAGLALIEHALALAPGSASALLQKAHCLLALGRVPELQASMLAARQAADDDVPSLLALGALCSRLGEHAAALTAYERALALAPNHPAALFNRATARRFLGDLTGAEQDYERVIAAQPEDCEAYLNRSELREQSRAHNHVQELEQRIARLQADWRGETQLRYALAKEYEDLGEYARSWSELERAARLRRRHLRYDVQRDVASAEWIAQAFPGPAPTTSSGHASDAPIFIIGLPRSGTTLVERILSSHSSVHAAGELDCLAAALTEAVRTAEDSLGDRRAMIEAAARLDPLPLAEDYLARSRPFAGGRAHFTDKMPLNYLYVGLIRRALPRARVVHLVRHPLAVCHAMYKTLFKDGYPFSYDLQEIGRYYIAYRRLMQHWHASLPGFVHDVSYERLITDQRGETRRLLELCGLEWEERCMEFHRNPLPATSASAAQVRRPLYDSSVARWRHYRSQLAPLRALLEAAGIEIED